MSDYPKSHQILSSKLRELRNGPYIDSEVIRKVRLELKRKIPDSALDTLSRYEDGINSEGEDSITHLLFPMRIHNLLLRSHITKINQLREFGIDELKSLGLVGPQTVSDISVALREFDSLKTQTQESGSPPYKPRTAVGTGEIPPEPPQPPTAQESSEPEEPEREKSIDELTEQLRQKLYTDVDWYVEELRQKALSSLPTTVYRMSIFHLPWTTLRGGTRALHALASYFPKEEREVTIGDVINLFMESEGTYLPGISNYGRHSIEVTYEIFRKGGIELPKVKPR